MTFPLSDIPVSERPSGIVVPSGAVVDRTVMRLAHEARQAGAADIGGARATIDLFNADGVTGDAIGRALIGTDVALRAAVCEELDAAGADYTDVILRSSATRLSSAANFPSRDGAISEVFFTGSDQPADTTWTNIFNVEDFRATTEEDFEVVDIDDAMSFRAYADGEEIEMTGVSGKTQKFPFALLAGGFQVLKTWKMDNKFWRIANGLRAMLVAYAVNQSRLAYNVLTNPTGLTVQVRDAVGNSVVEKDVNTVNAAATSILADVYKTDGHIPANPGFILVYNNLTPGYPDRAAAMMAANYGLANPALGAAKLTYPIQMLGTPHIPTGLMYLVMPGRKLKSGIRMDLTTYEVEDVKKFAEGRVGIGRYVHVRGSSSQVRAIPLA